MILDSDRAPLLIGLVAAGTLAAALVSQYGFGLYPCELCLWQRWPHAIVIGLAVLAVLLAPGLGRALLTALIGLVTAAGTAIAAYHVGVEAGWWVGPLDCAGPPLGMTDPAALVDALMATAPVRCDEVVFSVLGVSMAGWNGLLSAGLTVVAALAAWQMVARRRPAGRPHRPQQETIG